MIDTNEYASRLQEEISPVIRAWAKHLHEEVVYHADPPGYSVTKLCPHCLETAQALFKLQQDIICAVRLEDASDLMNLLSFSRERLMH